ncbi:serine/threonine-protein kinase [Actinomadura macrotermitis]|uniref:non-specific serine/threonine protein kinase n=1 Tax=Actinomadura macrotermitis TaxID=2585200 RepID=A0A7K0BXK2_9ACTN|nr:serine/threonine-protein kinase [Actinomadura macrotermitis]MQY05911.1 Serine/threonine-protein kinase PknD [Actinomadura macrotermitis]
MTQNGTGRTVAGRYRLTGPLGSGGMGTVWRADDLRLGRAVAVKELHTADDPVARRRCVREARSIARIDHPNVIDVHDIVDDGELWIVMELVDAPSLDRVLADRGPLPAAAVASIGAQLAAALDAVHRAGVLHRDVKPGNVLLRPDGRVRLTDFGIAAIDGDESLTFSGQLVGSPAYMSPERLAGTGAGPASDLWSLGVTLLTLLTGRSPFRRDGLPETLYAVRFEEPPIPADLGPLTTAITGLLRKNPRVRPTAQEVIRLLDPSAAPRRTPHRALWAGAIAALATAGALTASLLPDSPPQKATQAALAPSPQMTTPTTPPPSSKPTPTKQTSPPPPPPASTTSAPPPPSPHTSAPPHAEKVSTQVDSTSGWQSTGIAVHKGERLTLTSSGSWTVDRRLFAPVGPRGYDDATDARIYQKCKLDPGLNYGVLLGRVGHGAIFAIGDDHELTAPAAGDLQLRIHDMDHCLVDNAGSLLLTITHPA